MQAIRLPASVALDLCEELASLWCPSVHWTHRDSLADLGLADSDQLEALRQLLNRRFCLHLGALPPDLRLGELLALLQASLSWLDDANPPQPPYHF